MAWIQVHENLLYSVKLRKLKRILHCTRERAIGILVSVWIFAVCTADENGVIECVSPDDIYSCEDGSYTSEQVVSALLETGFLERGKERDSYIIHDWFEWQNFWIEEKRRKKKHAEYMRAQREKDQLKG